MRCKDEDVPKFGQAFRFLPSVACDEIIHHPKFKSTTIILRVLQPLFDV